MTTAQSPVDVLAHDIFVAVVKEWDGSTVRAKCEGKICNFNGCRAVQRLLAEADALAAALASRRRCACESCTQNNGECGAIPDHDEALCEHCIEHGHDSRPAAALAAEAKMDGTGKRSPAPDPKPTVCGRCEGAMFVNVTNFNTGWVTTKECPDCGGTGTGTERAR